MQFDTTAENYESDSVIGEETRDHQLHGQSTVMVNTIPACRNAGEDADEAESRDLRSASPDAVEQPREAPKRRRRRALKKDASEQRLLGRRSFCKDVESIAKDMLKTVKMRVLARHLESKRGLDDAELTKRLVEQREQIVGEEHVLRIANTVDSDVHRRNLKDIIIYVILLQEETYSLEESRLEERVLEYETTLVTSSEDLDFFDVSKHDPQRAHNYDTYRIVLEAAWRNNNDISLDEAELLRVLRQRLGISGEEHRLISAHINRFPKSDCQLHSRDEIHDARKELQRDGILWSYRDENNKSIDVIPVEVADTLRNLFGLQLQRTNFVRLLQHDCINVSDFRSLLVEHKMDRSGNKQELITRVAESDIHPHVVLNSLEKTKLSDMCRIVGLPSSGRKHDLCARLIEFYDDLTFEERETQDEREEWYSNYELLATRAYSDLRAKKLISKDLEVERKFEKATDFLIEEILNVEIDNSRQVTKSDGRILLGQNQVLLWDCKSCENTVNLQDHLEDQFDGYLRKERQRGFEPLAFLVIAPAFTSGSLKLAHQYKARTNWDIALIHADALKHIAEHWAAQDTELPFPIRLFNRTELIDVKLAEFLISMA